MAVFDLETRSGSVLSDAGERIMFDARAFEASGLLTLRLGQRVRVRRDDTGLVTALGIPTIPWKNSQHDSL